MTTPRLEKKIPDPEPIVPPGGLQMMALILVAMTLVTVYSSVQRARRGQIETVTIAPAAPSPTPAAVTP